MALGVGPDVSNAMDVYMPKFDFNSTAIEFDLLNAFRLAEMSDLAYQSLYGAEKILKTEKEFFQYKTFDVSDTQAFLVANKTTVILAFRGTETIQDWLTDAKIKLVPSQIGRVHFGFNQALEYVWRDLYDTICAWKGLEQTLWVTGHSLGGALATLAVDRLTEVGVDVAGMYTYGQPRVGDKDFAANFDRKMLRSAFRFTNDEDVVTRVPPSPGYRHIGTQCFFDNKGMLCRDNIFWHWFRSRSESVALRSSENASAARGQNPGGIRDHSLNYYLKYLSQTLNKEIGRAATFKDYINS